MTWLGVLALLSLVVEHGFHLGPRVVAGLQLFDVLLAGGFGSELLLSLLRASSRGALVRERWYEFALLSVFVGVLIVLGTAAAEHQLTELLRGLHVRSLAKALLGLVQLYVFASAAIRLASAQEHLLGRTLRPETLLVGGFGGLVALGTLLLALPRASTGRPLSVLDALFTSTSAVCVTGLTVVDTGSSLTPVGQAIVAVLFQVGGLGIMTFVSFASILAGRAWSVPQAVVVRELVAARTLADVRRQVRAIVLVTLVLELLGAVLLHASAPASAGQGLARAGWSLFHAVSAFCNAGFALQADSLSSSAGAVGVNLVVMALIVLGGLGIPVLRELSAQLSAWVRRVLGRPRLPGARRGVSLQSRLALVPTAILLAVGFVGFLALEAPASLAGRPALEQVLAAAFQSVTARTAGFNTVDIAHLRDATLVLLMLLMAVGASPISTGGGIKTATFAVLVLTVRSMLTGRARVEIAGRSLPRRVEQVALTVFVLYVLSASLAVLTLSITDPEMTLQDQVFEVVSALSTVGLSTGITAELSALGKLVLCVLMFVGRTGPLTLMLVVFRPERAGAPYRYPDEDLVLG